MAINVGTAGWAIPRHVVEQFPSEGASLERYASRLAIVEINSSFHRAHRQSTWTRWSDSVPPGFRFSVKMPKTITHQARLSDCSVLLDQFLDQARWLGSKLAVVLVQLPPSLVFDRERALAFFGELKTRTTAAVACEPRNGSWFSPEADALLSTNEVARVAADPALCDRAGRPGGWPGLRYWRLHGSPVMYRSSYADRIEDLAESIASTVSPASDTWCIFDNTASSAALGDALELAKRFPKPSFVISQRPYERRDAPTE